MKHIALLLAFAVVACAPRPQVATGPSDPCAAPRICVDAPATPPPPPTEAEREQARRSLAAVGAARADEAQCRYEASFAAASARGILMDAFTELNTFNLCMKAKAAARGN